jgi:hypothetical protein
MGSGASKSGSAVTAVHTPAAAAAAAEEAGKEPVKVDSRLPFNEFRELFTLKNYWKTVRRNDSICAKAMMYKCVELLKEQMGPREEGRGKGAVKYSKFKCPLPLPLPMQKHFPTPQIPEDVP